MRSCTDTTYKRAQQTGRPCLLGDIGKCAAPCVGRISKEDHKSIAVDFASFMSGNDSKFVRRLEKKMKAASAELDYEAAARYRDQLGAMKTAMSKNAVVLSEDIDTDFFGIAHDELAAAVQQFIVRGGRIRGTKSWVVDKELDVELPELVETVLQNAYTATTLPPREVVVPVLPDDAAELEQWLGDLRVAGEARTRRRCRSKTAQRGEKAALALTVATNAQERAGALQDPAQRRLHGAIAGARRHPGGARHAGRAAAHGVLRRLAPERHEHRRVDGGLRRRSADARTSTAGSASPTRPTTPSRSTRPSPGGSPTSTRTAPASGGRDQD